MPDIVDDPVLPDPVEALRLFLRTCSTVTAGVGDRIGTDLNGSQAAIRLALIGGAAGRGEGQPLVQVESWGATGDDDGSSLRTALAVMPAVERMRGEFAGGWVAGAHAEGHPFASPDPTSGRARHLLTVRLHTYALEGTA